MLLGSVSLAVVQSVRMPVIEGASINHARTRRAQRHPGANTTVVQDLLSNVIYLAAVTVLLT